MTYVCKTKFRVIKFVILSLEALRGLAALIVAFYHGPHGSILFIPRGYMAVYLFFSLSGFVIALNYFNKIDSFKSLVSFQKKRFFRLYPVHIFTLILVLLIQCLKYVAIELGLPAGQEAFGGFSGGESWYTLRDFILHIFLLQAVTDYGFFYHGMLQLGPFLQNFILILYLQFLCLYHFASLIFL